MKIETDDEFVALMRERFASKPYSEMWPGRCPEYWTDERYEELIAGLLKTQQLIRVASTDPPDRSNLTAEEWNDATAKWAIWSIVSHDVGATPTHWHRVWSAVQSVIVWARSDERQRIARALRDEQSAMLGKTASDLIASAVCDDCSARD